MRIILAAIAVAMAFVVGVAIRAAPETGVHAWATQANKPAVIEVAMSENRGRHLEVATNDKTIFNMDVLSSRSLIDNRCSLRHHSHGWLRTEEVARRTICPFCPMLIS